MKKVRVGIIGAGQIGKLHDVNLRYMKHVEIAAISVFYGKHQRMGLFNWHSECLVNSWYQLEVMQAESDRWN